MDIKDCLSGNQTFGYLTHTVLDEDNDDDTFAAVEIFLERDTTRDTGPIAISLKTRAQQYIVGNFLLISALKEFFVVADEGEDKIDLSYYADAAQK